MLNYIIQFLVLFIISYLCYFLMGNVKRRDKKKEMAEIAIFIKIYNIDLKKLAYDKLSKVIYLILSFDLALTVFLSFNLNMNILFKILLGAIILTTSTIISYRLLGLYYKKKGMTKNV